MFYRQELASLSHGQMADLCSFNCLMAEMEKYVNGNDLIMSLAVFKHSVGANRARGNRTAVTVFNKIQWTTLVGASDSDETIKCDLGITLDHFIICSKNQAKRRLIQRTS